MSSSFDRDAHARRRAQRERCLAHRRRQARLGYGRIFWFANATWKTNRAVLSKFTTTPTACSCWMCGNPRRYLGDVTLQEQTWNEEARCSRRWPERWSDDEGAA